MRSGLELSVTEPEDKHRVVATEGEGVGHHRIHGRGTRLVRHVVKVALRVWVVKVDGGKVSTCCRRELWTLSRVPHNMLCPFLYAESNA